MGDRNLLRALGLAGSRVGAVTESQLVHLGDHRLGAAGTLDAALRQLGQRRHARSDEEHGRTVLAGGGAGSAADAGGGIHRLVGVGLRDQDRVGIGHRVCAHRDEASGLENLVVGRAVDHEVLDDGEGGRTPRLDGDRGAVLELAHVDLARRGALAGTVGVAVDVQRAHAADTLAAVVVEGHGLLALVDEVVVQDVEHLEERGVGRDVFNLVGLESTLGFGVFLTPYLQCEIHNSKFVVNVERQKTLILVVALCRVYELEVQRLLGHLGSLVHALVLPRSEEHTSELQSRFDLVCRLLLEKKKIRRAHV